MNHREKNLVDKSWRIQKIRKDMRYSLFVKFVLQYVEKEKEKERFLR